MIIFVLRYIPFLLLIGLAHANCDSYQLTKKIKDKSCNCTTTSPEGIAYPKELKLNLLCNYTKISKDEIFGDFFFTTNLVLSGQIRREESDAGDIVFIPTFNTAGEFNRFESEMRYFRFEDENAPTKLLTSKLDISTRCWVAPVKLKINTIHSVLTPGTDNEGAYIQQYEILQLGKYRKCNAGESGFGDYVP